MAKNGFNISKIYIQIYTHFIVPLFKSHYTRIDTLIPSVL